MGKKMIDRTNLKYGMLTVLQFSGKDQHGRYLWLCSCECGNKKILTSDALAGGKTKNCGCIRRAYLSQSGNQHTKFTNREDAIIKHAYTRLKNRHKIKKMSGVFINYETFIKLSKSNCNYCGSEPRREIKDRLRQNKYLKNESSNITSILINGIDRIDSDIGYTVENSVSCCKICNYAKNDMSDIDFYNWIQKVSSFNIQKNK